MEIKITTDQILKVLQIASWVIFIGLCVEAGGIAVNTIITLFINPLGAGNFWEGSDYLSSLYAFDRGNFMVITIIMNIVAVLKAIMFYLIVKLFSEKKLNISQPFSTELRHFILNLSYLALGIGLFSHSGTEYCTWLTQQGAIRADLHALQFTGSDVWLFMAVVLFVIGQIVKRGIEIQNENELTI
jgi:hypothetical protein